MMPMMSCGDGKNENYYNMVIIGESMIQEMPPADIHTLEACTATNGRIDPK
ncbi:hypothetical protein ACHAXS_006755 [Conticribra weissflogii]